MTIDFDTWLIDESTYMTKNEHAILLCLTQKPGAAVSRRELVKAYWGTESVHSRAIDAAVRRLRLKNVPIENVPGFGFRIPADAVNVG